MAIINEMTDAAASTLTNYTMNVGDSFRGNITPNDDDWVEINLEAGRLYQIDLAGRGASGIGDTYLSFYDAAGNLVAWDDDSGPGLSSSLSFSPTVGGTYYISAAGYNSTGTGQYSLDVAVNNSSPLDALEWGGAVLDDSNTISVYFGASGTTYDDEGVEYTSDGFTATQIANIMDILDGLSDFADIQFTRTNNQNNANFKLVTDDFGSSTLAYMYPQGSSFSSDGLGVFNSNSAYMTAASTRPGGLMYETFIHELGHGIGMAHPHDNGGGSNVLDYAGLDESVFTVMSYNDGWSGHPLGAVNPNTNIDSGYMAGFGALDIAVLQSYYGTSASHNGGGNVYRIGVTTYYQTIWDTGGTDSIKVVGSSDATIDLRAATLGSGVGGGGFVSYTDNVVGGFTIANGVVIENAIGGSGNDTLIGNNAWNKLFGGSGMDTADYSFSTNTQTINLATNVNLGGLAHHDRLYSIEIVQGSNTNGDNITGSSGNDRLYGNGAGDILRGHHGNERLYGGEGNDYLYGGTGADIIDGGSGLDWAMYNGVGERVIIDLRNRGFAGEANGDVFTDIENARGSDYNDVMTGTNGTNKLLGSGGNDTLNGLGGRDNLQGGYGNDIINGGAGTDGIRGNQGNDIFIFATGNDVDKIIDFDDSGNDRVDISSWGTNYANVSGLMIQNGSSVSLNFGGGDILIFLNTDIADMSASDFIF